MNDIIEELENAISCGSEESILFEVVINEISRLRTALYEISQLTPGLCKSPEYHHLAVSEKFNEAKRIAAEALPKYDDLV